VRLGPKGGYFYTLQKIGQSTGGLNHGAVDPTNRKPPLEKGGEKWLDQYWIWPAQVDNWGGISIIFYPAKLGESYPRYGMVDLTMAK
jgi:hypothetical protein